MKEVVNLQVFFVGFRLVYPAWRKLCKLLYQKQQMAFSKGGIKLFYWSGNGRRTTDVFR